jgi:hypothetical protein
MACRFVTVQRAAEVEILVCHGRFYLLVLWGGGADAADRMRDTNDGGRALDASAHVLSRALVSQSASVTCCMFARVVVLFVLT